MANKKISELTDGTSFQSGDEAVVNRSGTNYKVDPTQFGSSIDVTGTVTADGLTLGNDDRVTWGTGAYIRGFGSGEPAVRVHLDPNDVSNFGSFSVVDGASSAFKLSVEGNGDISFYEDTGTTPKFFWDASAEALGIGTTSPAADLHVVGDTSTSFIVESTSATGFNRSWSRNDVAEGFSFLTYGSAYSAGTFMSVGAGGSFLEVDNNLAISAGSTLRMGIGSSEAMRLDASGNLLFGGTGTPTSSAGNFVLYNGTAPTGSATNGVILYAEDVSTSSELKVRDEAGNVTTLSPHNFDLIPEGPSEDMAWSYYSERDGKRINVDMLKAIRVLEQLSGEKLVHMA